MSIDLDTSDAARQFAAAFAKLDLMAIHSEIGEVLIESIDENFRSGGRYSAASAGAYTGGNQTWLKSGRADAEDGQTLLDTSHLVSSFSKRADRLGVIVGTNVKYARIQHYGGKVRITKKSRAYFRYRATIAKTDKAKKFWINMANTKKDYIVIPPRPFLVFQQTDMVKINMIIMKHFSKLFK